MVPSTSGYVEAHGIKRRGI